MALASKLCGECGGLNSGDAERCHRCGSAFPGALSANVTALLQRVMGRDLPMSKFFVGLCSLVFAFITLDSGELSLMGSPAKWPLLRWGAVAPGLAEHEPWRLLSATFIHFGALHIVFNMLALIDLGKMLERPLGSPRFGLLFVTTALSGFIASHVWYGYVSQVNVLTGGASGGIFGLYGALIGSLYARRDPAWKAIGVRFALYAILFAVMLPVNNAAHAGGFLLGLPAGYLFQKERRPAAHHRLFRALAAVCVVSCLVSIALSAASDLWRTQRTIELRST
jgi:rhomboid protease GluP